MINLQKTEVLASVENGVWKDGKLISYSVPGSRVLVVGHEKREIVTEDEKGKEKREKKDYAFEFRVKLPVTRARAITSAEMAAYNLQDDLDVASFNAGLARKFRQGTDVKEVKEHDEFIAWIKKELTSIGI